MAKYAVQITHSVIFTVEDDTADPNDVMDCMDVDFSPDPDHGVEVRDVTEVGELSIERLPPDGCSGWYVKDDDGQVHGPYSYEEAGNNAETLNGIVVAI